LDGWREREEGTVSGKGGGRDRRTE
jgi:hypothetical protein